MQVRVLLLALLVLVTNITLAQNQDYQNYIERYKDIAIREMERAGIPASIKLAQGLLESGAGKSDLARRANNHFGIKCNKEWDGKTYYKKDDDYNNHGKLIESCFRSYKNPEASFIAHSEFLLDETKYERYGFLFRLDPTDYKRWAKGLRSAGYATDPRYANRLIDLIERYELHRYDNVIIAGKSEDIIDGKETFPGDVAVNGFMINNDVKYVLALDNEPLAEIAQRTFISVSSLLNFNEELRSSDERLQEGRKIYIQPKRNSYRGKQTWHYVKPGEKMADISNEYAVKLSKLYERNSMILGNQPAVNERIKLRGGKVDNAPKLLSDVSRIEPLEPGLQFDVFEEEELLDTVEIDVSVPGKTIAEDDESETLEETLPITVTNDKPSGNTANKPTMKPETNTSTNKPTVPTVPVVNIPVEEETEIDFGEDMFEKPKPPVEKVEVEVKPVSEAAVYHTIVKGDTLWNISQRYGTTVQAIKKLNDLNSNNIRLGTRLKVK